MYNKMKFSLARFINEDYYQKLITNLTKELYDRDKSVLEIFEDFYHTNDEDYVDALHKDHSIFGKQEFRKSRFDYDVIHNVNKQMVKLIVEDINILKTKPLSFLSSNIALEKLKENHIDLNMHKGYPAKSILYRYASSNLEKISDLSPYIPYEKYDQRLPKFNEDLAELSKDMSYEIVHNLKFHRKYKELNEILTNDKLKETDIYLELIQKIYPTSYKFIEDDFGKKKDYIRIVSNTNNLDLLQNIIKASPVGDEIKKQYIDSFLLTIQRASEYEINQKMTNEGITAKEKKEIQLDFLKTHITNNVMFNDDLENVLLDVMDRNKVDKKLKNDFIISLMDSFDIAKDIQFEMLKNKYPAEDSIFKVFLKNSENLESFFDRKTTLIIDNKTVSIIGEAQSERNIDILKGLIYDIEREDNVNKKLSMTKLLVEHFELENIPLTEKVISSIKLEDISELKKDIDSNEFNDLYYELSNENGTFESRLSQLA